MENTTDIEQLVTKPEIKLLIVDDREDNLLSMETILQQDGYSIKTANSGRAALKILLKDQDFTLILMDVQMPGLSGFETAALMYEWEKLKHIPIIFITANDFADESIFKGYETGGVEYLYKPVNPELLRAKVAVFAELYKKNHALIAQEKKLMLTNKELEKEIQDRKNSEEKVNKLNKQLLDNIWQLKNINEELERFAYIASHDLQEPLRKIIIFGDRLQTKFQPILGEEGNDYLNRMINASNKMQVLIKNILAFSKSAATTETDVFETTDLNQLLTGVLSDLELNIEQKNALITIEKLPTIHIIPGLFKQLFQNLLINALKFSKPNVRPEINIDAKMIKGYAIEGVDISRSNNDFCNLYIKDNGIGFEQQYADQIFMIFKRLHSYDHIEGTGIGLSICKKIIEKHKGYITANGEPGIGATFIISIPLDIEAHAIKPDNKQLSDLITTQ
ncbi:MAG: sensor histidine kinase [Flavipsychrobacter sp.]